MIAIVPVLLHVGLMEQRKTAADVLLLLIIVEVQLHVAIHRRAAVALLLIPIILQVVLPLVPIHRVSLHPLVRVVTQVVVEVPVPVPVRQVEVVVEEDKMIGFIKKTYL